MTKNTYIYAEFQGIYMNDSFIGIENAKKYINNWDKWEEIFPEEVINWLVNEVIKMSDIYAVEYIPTTANNVNYYENHYKRLPEVARSYKFTEAWGEWTRPCYRDAYQYVVPCRFQTVYLRKAFTEAIRKAYPYLSDYEFNAYVPEYLVPPELYINLSFNYNGEETTVSLYCPIKAFKDKNPQLIYDRHYGYNSDYYRNQPENKDRILAVLESEEYKALCAKVKEG